MRALPVLGSSGHQLARVLEYPAAQQVVVQTAFRGDWGRPYYTGLLVHNYTGDAHAEALQIAKELAQWKAGHELEFVP